MKLLNDALKLLLLWAVASMITLLVVVSPFVALGYGLGAK